MTSTSHKTKGFTLIELLTVIVILAIVAGMVTLSIGNDPHRIVENTAKRFADQFSLVAEESILQGLDYGIRIDEQNYQYLQWDQTKWQPPLDQTIAKTQYFPEEVEIELIIDQNTYLVLESEETDVKFENYGDNEIDLEPPQILVLSSGEITPFKLIFRSVYSDDYLELNVDTFGRTSVERFDEI